MKRHSNDEVNPNKRINDGIFIVSSVAKLCLLKIKYILLLFQTIKFQKYSNNLFLACRERSGAVKRRVLRCEPSESADRDRVQAERKWYDVVRYTTCTVYNLYPNIIYSRLKDTVETIDEKLKRFSKVF